ncbi:phospholipase [Stenotrophomonas sp. ESTM1D_MKCIP4_1]|uniref:phospholipase D-like domain-containing protein n=1 Tax=Stenotrophomonas sp. ESTM1D_MKCIP4_1 TaxID=2072414 RepID=UPI000D5405A5|nr:phospholipase D-like domain-containing protein [Stenotrophomonas sp. ESTM1D_MKCIP4_1]AWH52942.1 phospholipase [Stenotrophomonas sp. ESTM1D_MKCIP4_1]
MADGTTLGSVPHTTLTCLDGQKGTTSGDYYAPPDRQFAPVRQGNRVDAYTDGRSAMKAMADAIRGAQKFIFIADWQMNFDTELDNRGGAHASRLSELLFDAINQRGVDVRVLLYDSVEAAAYTHENEARTALYKMQDANTPGQVQVGLHNPATGRTDAFNIAFSHHQKILVVDGHIGFVGGLDIAHGRWDDGNFDVVCAPALHVLNDHYNNCLSKYRGMTDDEKALTVDKPDTRPDAAGRVHPGFAQAYVPGLAIAVDQMKAHWDAGAALAELQDYADKLGLPEALQRKGLEVLADWVIDGVEEGRAIHRTVARTFLVIQKQLEQIEKEYADVIAASNRAADEAVKLNPTEAARAAGRAVGGFTRIQAVKVGSWLDERKAEVRAVALRPFQKAARTAGYILNPRSLVADIEGQLAEIEAKFDNARKDWEALVKWINTPIDRTQRLLDCGRQPRMPWQDVHARLEGPAVFDLCCNFMHRWNAMVWQNQRGDREVGMAARSAMNKAVTKANEWLGTGMPEQTTLARGMELTALTDQWLASMGGTAELFGDLTLPGTAGGMNVQILRSSGTALHALEKKGCKQFGLNLDDASCLQPYWERNQPMHSILDAMVNCIASASAFVYLETQFLISDCGWSDAGPGSVVETSIKEGERRPLTDAEKKKVARVDRAIGMSGPLGKTDVVQAAVTRTQGVKSAASNPLVATLAARIRRAILAGQGFHVYITLPVHPEGSLADGAVLKQQYWVQQTLLRGDDSLIRRICRSLIARDKSIREASVEEADLQAEVKAGRWKEYLSVMNLRSYGVLAETRRKDHLPPHTIGSENGPSLYVVTEQCYVHSKLLIVDDAVAIIGSANCNDRSLLGTGDTEIAAVIVDGEAKPMDLGNGMRVITRKFARDLRMRLWKKFLGQELEEIPEKGKKLFNFSSETESCYPWFHKDVPTLNVDRPASSITWAEIRRLADENSIAYQRVFTNVPRDSFTRYDHVFHGFPSDGLNDNGHVRRCLYAQPPDLRPEFMLEPSVVTNYVTSAVGRHDAEKATKFLRGADKRKGIQGFWVTMPLLWGNGMDDPAAKMPSEIIAVEPDLESRSSELAYSVRAVHGEHGERA